MSKIRQSQASSLKPRLTVFAMIEIFYNYDLCILKFKLTILSSVHLKSRTLLNINQLGGIQRLSSNL